MADNGRFKLFECPICLEPYDTVTRIPKFQPTSCRHSCCRLCLMKIFEGIRQCAECRESYRSSARPSDCRCNTYILDGLQTRQPTTESGLDVSFCPTHEIVPRYFYCKQCQKEVCGYCAFTDHQGHDLPHVDVLSATLRTDIARISGRQRKTTQEDVERNSARERALLENTCRIAEHDINSNTNKMLNRVVETLQKNRQTDLETLGRYRAMEIEKIDRRRRYASLQMMHEIKHKDALTMPERTIQQLKDKHDVLESIDKEWRASTLPQFSTEYIRYIVPQTGLDFSQLLQAVGSLQKCDPMVAFSDVTVEKDNVEFSGKLSFCIKLYDYRNELVEYKHGMVAYKLYKMDTDETATVSAVRDASKPYLNPHDHEKQTQEEQVPLSACEARKKRRNALLDKNVLNLVDDISGAFYENNHKNRDISKRITSEDYSVGMNKTGDVLKDGVRFTIRVRRSGCYKLSLHVLGEEHTQLFTVMYDNPQKTTPPLITIE